MNTMKRALALLLTAALLMSLFTLGAFASRQTDAVSYLKEYVKKNGKETVFFNTHTYQYTGATLCDEDCYTTNSNISYEPGTDSFTLSNTVIWGSGVSLKMDAAGKFSTCGLTSSFYFQELPFDPAQVRRDTALHYTGEVPEYENREIIERNITLAFHRLLAFVDQTLKTGGYSLADLGFTSYTPYQSVCVHLDQCPGSKFTDMPTGGIWDHDPIDWAVSNGITDGVTPTAFKPGNTCTRAQVVTFLWRAAGKPLAESRENPFEDVAQNAYYYEAVLWAVEQGITDGITPTLFKPENTCTRAQVVTFLWRYQGSPEQTVSDRFTDVLYGSYYEQAVAWAVAKGITKGITSTTFAPEQSCTRSHVVCFLWRCSK